MANTCQCHISQKLVFHYHESENSQRYELLENSLSTQRTGIVQICYLGYAYQCGLHQRSTYYKGAQFLGKNSRVRGKKSKNSRVSIIQPGMNTMQTTFVLEFNFEGNELPMNYDTNRIADPDTGSVDYPQDIKYLYNANA